MKNFITGSAGFIASHLIQKIGGVGYDNFSVSNAVSSGKEIKGDVLDFTKLSRAMKDRDMVWHLAASGDIANGMKNTSQDLKNNVMGTHNVLEAMRLNGISKLVFSSSATYYGKQPAPWVESLRSEPSSLYGFSKVASEAEISAYSCLFGLQAWVFRFGNVVGGHMGHGVLFDFIQKLRANPKELEIVGDGEQKRPFFLVEDCIDGMLCATKYPPSTYNLGCKGGDYTSINDVARIVIEEMELSDVKITHRRGGIWDVPIVSLNTDKINALGWKPRYTSDEAARIAVRRLLK